MSISATPKTAVAGVTQAAQVPPPSTVDSGDIEGLPGQLVDLVAALRVAAEACGSAASWVVPDHGRDDRVSSRYAEAAARWPSHPAPSHERFALVFADLHQAANSVRLAARRLETGQRELEAMLAPCVHRIRAEA